MCCCASHHDRDASLLSGCRTAEFAFTSCLWLGVFRCNNAALNFVTGGVLHRTSISVGSALQCDGTAKGRTDILGDYAGDKFDNGISDGAAIWGTRCRLGFYNQLQFDLLPDDRVLPG